MFTKLIDGKRFELVVDKVLRVKWFLNQLLQQLLLFITQHASLMPRFLQRFLNPLVYLEQSGLKLFFYDAGFEEVEGDVWLDDLLIVKFEFF